MMIRIEMTRVMDEDEIMDDYAYDG